MSSPIWTPSKERIEQTNMVKFLHHVQKQKPKIRNYHDLYTWSVKNSEEFWSTFWNFSNVVSKKKWDKVLINRDQMPGAKWFTGSKLNFAENLLTGNAQTNSIIACNETQENIYISNEQLRNNVAHLAHAFLNIGIKPGDRIAGYLPNVPETIIGMLATTAIGAVWSSCSQDFGVQAVLDRFGQIEPKVLLCTDGYLYQGKKIHRVENLIQISNNIETLDKTIIVPFLSSSPELNKIKNAVLFENFLDDSSNDIPFVHVDFNHPLYILYSSGTTGKPKCIVHGTGGTLLQILKEHILHTDIKSDDVVFYFTTCGWMMWNWLVTGLATGASIILYDGSPFYPQATKLFDLIDEKKISVFGTSAKYLSAAQKLNLQPRKNHNLSSLKTILSTGSPLAPEQFDYVYQDIKTDLQLSSISGGTDIVSCFALGNPILPVYRGELQCRGLGLSVEIYNDQEESVVETKGELVCTKPFPSMPVNFWNDDSGEKYRATYFKKFPGVWAHGDYAELTKHNGMIIYGRSDAVLNPGGVRIGTAEIYRQVEKRPEVMESIAVAQEWESDTRIILFVKLKKETTLTEQLEITIKQMIRENTSPRHVPAKIIQVNDIPRTISGKIVELAVQNIIHNRPVHNIDALANPEALDYFRNLSELSSD